MSRSKTITTCVWHGEWFSGGKCPKCVLEDARDQAGHDALFARLTRRGKLALWIRERLGV